MNRLEELVQKSLDSELSRAEEQELDALLASSAAARQEYRQLLEVEVALRNLDEQFDVSDSVMEHLELLAAPIQDEPEQELPQRPDRILLESPLDRWFLRIAVPIAATAGMVLAFLLFNQEDFQTTREVPKTAATSKVEGFEIVRQGTPQSGTPNALQPKDQLVAQPGAQNRLTYEDKTQVQMTEGTKVIYEPEFKAPQPTSKRLELLAGSMRAEVTKQPEGTPFVVKTPHALAIVRGTTFTLSSNARETRLAVTEGQVDLQRSRDGAKVSVPAGMFAVTTDRGDLKTRPMRSSSGLLAYYTFQEGQGERVHDLSGKGMDLEWTGKNAKSPQWSNSGLKLVQPGYLASAKPANSLIDACRKSGEVTIEAWVQPSDSTQTGPARIVSLSETSAKVNFLLGHGTSDKSPSAYTSRLRTSKSPNDEELKTKDKVASTKLTHLVFTRDKEGNALLYVNGKKVESRKIAGSLSNWHRNLKLALGDDPGNEDRGWKGTYRLVAIYGRALSAKDVSVNFASGPDQEMARW